MTGKFLVFCRLFSAVTCLMAATSTFAQEFDPTEADFNRMRSLMIEELRRYAVLASVETGIKEFDDAVLEVMGVVPRHEFVPKRIRRYAYLNTPLPLGHDQNISQPYIIALMTHLARVEKSDVIFETGTGAGYHGAILSRLGSRVFSVEVVKPLVAGAKARLKDLGYDNIEIKHGVGYYGWREKGPYDVMIIKEAIHHIPPPLLNQLKRGGRMVAPVGPLDGAQMLKLIEKDAEGKITERAILPVQFSPLQGGERI
ncbi:MAG TPA: protein-L-isoaspartate O-methyltransferase [Rhodospirillaceae bacterium]|nr:protein-L-isoaspartate O-methyltransferase [Rhodospirillaceae bacterium]